jgi:penicillin-binding protein 1C
MNKGPGKKWQRWRQWGAVAGIAVAFLAVGSGLKVRKDFNVLQPLPQITDLSLSVVVLDRNDRLLRAFTSQDEKWRLPVELEDVDPLYIKMLLAFEDKRFFKHDGIDIRALVRSGVSSVRHGRIVSGGSTLTMQVARLLSETPTKTFARKYEQMLKAVQLERGFTKEEILQIYLLRAPFGGNLEGVRAASLTWFGKEPRRLTPAEAALLVALPQSPEARRPDKSPESARIARNRVLARAVEAGVLERGEADAAANEPVRAKRYAMPFLAPHESRRARFAAPEKIKHLLTLDRELQSSLEKLARQKIGAYAAPVSLAIMVADHQNGEILASVGAPNLLDSDRLGHIDMTRAIRSPGSTLKPFIYGLAFEEGIGLPESYIVDRPTDIGGYQPTNFDQAYQGTVTLREALQLSLNTPAVQLLEAVGPARLIARLKRAGVRPALKEGTSPGLAISLGGLGMSLKDLTQAYAALGRGGRPVSLTVCRGDCKASDAAPNPGQVLSGKAAWFVGDILSGLPQALGAETSSIAYKTGTAYGYRDAWTVGYDGRYTVAVWLGRPDGSPVPGETGAKAAVPLLFDVFQKLGADRVPLREAPTGALSALSRKIPEPLRFARLPGRPDNRHEGESLQISYPPNGAELDLGISEKPGQTGSSQPLVVKFKGGVRPYFVLINGAPLSQKTRKRQLVWQPDTPGFANVTILDANGTSAKITVLLR